MKHFLIGLLLLLSSAVRSQSLLEEYIKQGLENNIVVKQKNISLEKAMFNLKEAQTLFLPSVNFNSTYQTGKGGRYFNFPIGDLMNPVYSTLNNLTEANNFPQVENQEFYFLPHDYYDAHVRTSVPIVNTDLIYNKSIKREQVNLQQFEVDIYKRELVKNIKISYYNYLSALSAVKIYESALTLVNKNLEINQSLLKNGKGLPASVLRSESEVEKVIAQLVESKNQVTNASRYFNFLLNKPLTEKVEVDVNLHNPETLSLLETPETSNREELKQLAVGRKIYDYQYGLSKSYWVPKVSAFLDLGSQGTGMEFSSKSKYYFVGVQLDIPIFNGFRNSYGVSRSKLDVKYSDLNTRNVSQQLELSAETAKNNLNSAQQEHHASQKQNQAARSYFKLIEKGYQEGTNNLIEFLDARNQLTASELQLTITTYKVLQAIASLERETASFAINQ
jgi:outer membrane protein